MDKAVLLDKIRNKASVYAIEIAKLNISNEKKAGKINKEILAYRDKEIEKIIEKNLPYDEQLDAILLITYVTNVVMLEARNTFWKYDYMAFARRIGEIWEPFCKLPFIYPVKKLQLYAPPSFADIHQALKCKIDTLVQGTDLPDFTKNELLQYYSQVWQLIDSGNINLSLDLHFEQNGVFYDVDYKSGFSSNEKGNTNRLLLVGSIYDSLEEVHKNLMFVRQPEEENNHYLQTLKNSPYWKVYCFDEAYAKIHEFTGFDLKAWMNANMDWHNDISIEFKDYLTRENLLKYLTW
ncbi:MAG: hypothetical protein RRY02_09570 [Muribaculaceae bacterium]